MANATFMQVLRKATGRDRASEPAPTDAHPQHARIQQLQRSAGNGAVADLLASGRPAASGPDGGTVVAAEDAAHEAHADAIARRARSLTPAPDPRGAPDGAAIAPAHQEQLQRLVGADVGDVRIHTGGPSQRSTAELGAHAFTAGKDIHFGAGGYDPGSRAGMELLAHEVAHTVQQPAAAGAGGELVHAKLKGTKDALVSMGGAASKSLRKKVLGSKWNDLLKKTEKYEQLEDSYQAALKKSATQAQQLKPQLLAALQSLEQAAYDWQRSNDHDDAEAVKQRWSATDRNVNDRADDDERTKASRRQAVHLFLTRVRVEAADLATGRAGTSTGLDDSQLSWGKDNAVGGGMNRLDQVAYGSSGGPMLEGYFKAEKGFAAPGELQHHEKMVGITQHDPNYGARSVAMYRLDQLLQGGVIARTEFAVHTSRTAVKGSDKGGKQTEEATTKLGFVTEKAKGQEMSSLLEKGQVLRTAGEREKVKAPETFVDLEDPVLQRCLNKLQIMDAIAGQLDRHKGNYFVDRDPKTGKVLGITGIDNDMSFGANMATPDDRSANQAHNYVGLPELVDADFGRRLLQVTEKQIRDTLLGILSPAEIDATVSRFAAVQDVVRSLEKKGQLTATWDASTAKTQLDGDARASMLGREGTEQLGRASYAAEEELNTNGVDARDVSYLCRALESAVASGRLALTDFRLAALFTERQIRKETTLTGEKGSNRLKSLDKDRIEELAEKTIAAIAARDKARKAAATKG